MEAAAAAEVEAQSLAPLELAEVELAQPQAGEQPAPRVRDGRGDGRFEHD